MKNEIRKKFKLKRKTMEKSEVVSKSSKACKHFLESDFYKNAKTIMLYMPLGNETDTTDIINRAFSDGKKVAFPVTDEASGDITPCYATAQTEFSKGGFSVREPDVKVVAKPTDFDVIIVPGIAFDKKGNRIGFGKGCYDKLLVKTNCIKVGFCYDFQLCDNIPTEETDIKMEYIITESGINFRE